MHFKGTEGFSLTFSRYFTDMHMHIVSRLAANQIAELEIELYRALTLMNTHKSVRVCQRKGQMN